MDWKIFLTTFGAVFIAEMADKTQIVSMGLSAKSGKPLTVFAGSVLAYVVVTALSILIGTALGKYLRPEWIKQIGAFCFILIGILMALGKI